MPQGIQSFIYLMQYLLIRYAMYISFFVAYSFVVDHYRTISNHDYPAAIDTAASPVTIARTRGIPPCHFIVHSCTVIITRDAKERILMPRQNQPRSAQFADAINQLPRELSMCPPSTHSSRGPRTHAPFFFFIYVISNSHLLFHERCNTLMRARLLYL